MERALVQVPHVERMSLDFQAQRIWVRFHPGERATREDLVKAVAEQTMFTPGEATYLYRIEELPDDLR